jgi:putative two-component system hydrogenase maturation factor HypX/HoxX
MRILLLTHSFNSLSQRLFAELEQRGHESSVEFDIADSVTEEAVALFRPEVVIAPFLKRAIPESVWRSVPCLVVHPGIKGDRGPSALDWATMNGEASWGVTVLQANAEMDAGDIWASIEFPMRAARKSSLYRNEVTEAAVQAVMIALERLASGTHRPEPLDYARPDVRGGLRPPMKQAVRRIDWTSDDTATVLTKIRAGDGNPGVLDEVLDLPCYLYDAHPEATLRGASPGAVIAQRQGAILRATRDGAVWITRLKPVASDGERNFKLPAAMVLGSRLDGVPVSHVGDFPGPAPHTWREIWYEERGEVGYLHFDFYNGAMSSTQCERLKDAIEQAARRPTRVIVLMGGQDFWSNGMDLNVIEAAASPADESWRNINAIDDVAQAILNCDSHLTVSALRGNAGAGGVFLALAADEVWARSGLVLNPHYKNMGNLYGSEYWTYVLPRRIGPEAGRKLMQQRLPLLAGKAAQIGLVDACFGEGGSFVAEIEERARILARDPSLPQRLEAKRRRRHEDEASKPLAAYRAEELERMKLNFYGFDSSYHVARYNFVTRVPHSWTPRHLARHRSRAGMKPEQVAA